MASKADTPEALIDVTVVILEGGYASTAIGPIEVFHSAGRLWNSLRGEPIRPRFRVRTASPDGKPVGTVCSVGLRPELSLSQVRRTDIVILPASGLDLQDRIARNTSLIPWMRRMHERGAIVAGICSGVAFLAEAGLLDGREATTHWAVADIMQARYPKVRWRAEQFVTEDGQMLCSGGVYASIDLSLYMVEKFCGHEVALQTAKSLLVSMPRSSQKGYAVSSPSRPHADEAIRKAEDHLRRHFREGMSMEDVAKRFGMSGRNFIRRFKAATGRLPGEYVQLLRVAAARHLLEAAERPIANVSNDVGYEDVAFCRSVFKRHTGMTPAEYRGRFASMTFDRQAIAEASP
jgi:transcriptional regulator GlxA family with amidase domain